MFNFETHITVDITTVDQLDTFKRVCNMMNVKPIIINPTGDVSQVMTSSTTRRASLQDVIDNVYAQAFVLKENNLRVIREKIESCPKFIKMTGAEYHYWEIHVPCHTDKLSIISSAGLSGAWHTSRNEFKPNVTMLTFRSANTNDITIKQHDIDIMLKLGIVTPSFKDHVEYAVYDTNYRLDDKWLKIER